MKRDTPHSPSPDQTQKACIYGPEKMAEGMILPAKSTAVTETMMATYSGTSASVLLRCDSVV